MSKKSNELKLIKNARRIAKDYMQINDSLLESIILEDKDKFKRVAIEKSDQNFLSGILDSYELFTDELMNVLSEENSIRINQLRREKEKKRPVTITTPKRKVKPKLTVQKPGKLRSKKGTYNKWTKQEENRINTLLKAEKTSKEIFTEINIHRIENDQILRTRSSINTKVYRLKNN